VEVHLKLVQDFFDAATFGYYCNWRDDFFLRNTRDHHQDRSVAMTVDGFRDYVLVQQSANCIVHPVSQTLASFFLLGFLYDLFVFQGIPHARYALVKQLSIYPV